MKIIFNKSTTQNFDLAIQKEWLETNGLGGWASSTIIGANTRRYHGLLVAAMQPPVGRMVLVSKMDETILLNEQRFELGCNQFPGAVHPQGYQHLQAFEKDVFPIFKYEAAGIIIQKTIAAVDGENTILVLYETLQAPSSFLMELQPFFAGRDFHSLVHANYMIQTEVHFQEFNLQVQPYPGIPQIYIAAPEADFYRQPDWYYQFEYAVEQYRGLDFREDLFSYGTFRKQLSEGDKWGVIISTTATDGRDAFDLFQQEKQRREKLLVNLPPDDDIGKTLALAADQFIVRRGDNLRSIIAGYHWFADWGRDAMIALPGLCMATGRFDDAKQILRAFAQSVDQGMLPNRFPDEGETPEYNTVDATLWFFVAIYHYLHKTNDEKFIREELLPVLQEIVDWHDRGTRFNIHVDVDGLLYAGEPGVQLTWMDVKIGEWVVTPRQGKAVEINALWYNALKIYAELLHHFGEPLLSEKFEQRAERVRRAFQKKFWFEEGGYLYDVIDGDVRDAAIRPNQIFAISLPFPLLTGKKARQVLKIVAEKLYTPMGLRSLAPDDPNYRPNYGGDQLSRDSAYHQGTVWNWLLGPFIDAIMRVEGTRGRKRATKIIENFLPHLKDAGIGTISEIFDAEPPHAPRGCIAQAWSVGELLRAYFQYRLFKNNSF
jgi:predicted glycogen debranching enzyme